MSILKDNNFSENRLKTADLQVDMARADDGGEGKISPITLIYIMIISVRSILTHKTYS